MARRAETRELSEKQARTLDTATRLVLLAANPREAEGARDSLRRIGLDYEIVAQRDFGSGDTAFLVVVGDMARRGSVNVQ